MWIIVGKPGYLAFEIKLRRIFPFCTLKKIL